MMVKVVCSPSSLITSTVDKGRNHHPAKVRFPSKKQKKATTIITHTPHLRSLLPVVVVIAGGSGRQVGEVGIRG